jgi:6-phosphogluconolactonase
MAVVCLNASAVWADPGPRGLSQGVSVASRAAAEAIADWLVAGLAEDDRASFVATGGSTPGEVYDLLSTLPLPWEQVTVGLADERMVPAGHPRRNEALVRAHLLQNEAAAATFETLLTEEGTPNGRLPTAIDVLVAGMGSDGHTASLFPDDPGVEPLLREPGVGVAHPPNQPEARFTRCLPDLVGAARLFLQIEGESKKAVFSAAKAPGPVAAMPIRGLLRSGRLDVFTTP